ncbi:hypothetical protein [Deinococcus pimensis]|uniref:hypothetical protein n=1 Tax=Deinococcus pimensis TaxID=309888 RepID=UPI00048748F6|nr:hypothetical protein [Deinococcus pimensis]
MTDQNDRDDSTFIPEHGDTGAFEGDETRRARVQRIIDEGREAELGEEDYAFALSHGLIEG